MKLGLNTSISLILSLPAHRSNNKGHQSLGNKCMDLLFEYKNEDEDRDFNMAIIASILSATRAFSVQRDKISGEWKVLEEKKGRIEILISQLSNLSLLNKNSYFTKIVSLIPSLGVILDNIISTNKLNYWQYLLITIAPLILIEMIIQISICLLQNRNGEKSNEDKSEIWKKDNLTEYQKIIKYFIDEYIEMHKIFYPNENKVDGYIIETNENIEELKQKLVNIHFYLG